MSAADYRKLQKLMNELTQVYKECGGKDEKREEEMKLMDDFQRKRTALNEFLQQLSEDTEKLMQLRADKKGDGRGLDEISIISDNQNKLREAQKMFNALKEQLTQDKKKNRIEEKEFVIRFQQLNVYAKEIETLAKKNSRVKEIKSNIALVTDAGNRQSLREKKELDRKKRRERQKRRGQIDEEDIEELPELTAQEQMFLEQVQRNEAEQNMILDEMSKGLEELKVMSLDIQEKLKVQNEIINVVDEKLDRNIEQFQSANKRLKAFVDSVSEGWWLVE